MIGQIPLGFFLEVQFIYWNVETDKWPCIRLSKIRQTHKRSAVLYATVFIMGWTHERTVVTFSYDQSRKVVFCCSTVFDIGWTHKRTVWVVMFSCEQTRLCSHQILSPDAQCAFDNWGLFKLEDVICAQHFILRISLVYWSTFYCILFIRTPIAFARDSVR